MVKKQKYTARCFIQIDEGEPIPIEKLSEEEKEVVFAKMSKRLSEGMSRYYGQHPDEFENL